MSNQQKCISFTGYPSILAILLFAMDQQQYREQHHKRTDERIKLHSLVLRSLLNLLLITIVGTVTVFATRTQTNWATLMILGSFAILVIGIACAAVYFYIIKEIKRL